jgi:hypothetical protein
MANPRLTRLDSQLFKCGQRAELRILLAVAQGPLEGRRVRIVVKVDNHADQSFGEASLWSAEAGWLPLARLHGAELSTDLGLAYKPGPLAEGAFAGDCSRLCDLVSKTLDLA